MTATREASPPDDWTAAGAYEVTPSVYRIPLPLPSDGLRAVNVYAIDHGDSLTLIDGGWAVAETTAALERALAELGHTFTDIGRILVTHSHRDHYSYAVELRRRWGTHIALGIGEAGTLEAIRQMAAGRAKHAQLVRLRAAGAADLADAISRGPRTTATPEDWSPPDEWLDGRQQITLKDRSLDAVPTPGHTHGHVAFADEAAGSLFAGDHLLPHITPSIGFEAAPVPSPLGDYLQSLAETKSLPDLRLLPAHGPVAASTHERADALLAHHDRRLDASAAVVAAGARTGLEVARELKWTRRERRLEDLDPFNQMLAVLETVAHLVVLVAQGRLRHSRLDGVDHYEP